MASQAGARAELGQGEVSLSLGAAEIRDRLDCQLERLKYGVYIKTPRLGRAKDRQRGMEGKGGEGTSGCRCHAVFLHFLYGCRVEEKRATFMMNVLVGAEEHLLPENELCE